MIRIASVLNCILLASAMSTCLLDAGSGRAQTIVCPPMPVAASTNVPQPPAPRKDHVWLPELLRESARFRVFGSSRFLARVRQDADKQVIFLFGTFTNEDEAEIGRISQALVPNKNTIVSFNFGGGTGGAIFAFRGMIQSLCNRANGCVLRTEVSSGHRCGSYCISLFMMGQVRVADTDAEFGFHSATNGYCKMPGDAQKAYKLAGVSSSWLDAHADYFLERDVTWLTPPQMTGSNIVTIIATKKK